MLFSVELFFSSVTLVHGLSYTDIDVATAYEMMTNGSFPDLVILDVRSKSEYDEEHLENATLIPSQDLDLRIHELVPYNDTEIIVYCLTGTRSARSAEFLADNNFTKVFNLIGGITEWKSVGYITIPEFASWIMPLLLITVTAILVTKRKLNPSKTGKLQK